MKVSPIAFFGLAAICQTAGSSGAAMLAPFFMKEHGYSIALVGIPLLANGAGRVCSDLFSGLMATYFSSGALLIAAVTVGFAISVIGYIFRDIMPVFLAVFLIFGLTEAMFALSLRKIGFDRSAPERQGRVQGQMAAALGIGFTLGPLLGGFIGKWLGPSALFLLYAVPEVLALVLVLLGGAHRYHLTNMDSSTTLWRESMNLLRKPAFLASCLAVCQSFFFLVGVTRVVREPWRAVEIDPILPVRGNRIEERILPGRREDSDSGQGVVRNGVRLTGLRPANEVTGGIALYLNAVSPVAEAGAGEPDADAIAEDTVIGTGVVEVDSGLRIATDGV